MLGIGRRGPLGRAEPESGGGPAWAQAGTPAGPERTAGDVGDAERDAWVILSGVDGVGPVSFGRLLGAFGSAAAVLRAAADRGALQGLVGATMDGDGGSPTLTAGGRGGHQGRRRATRAVPGPGAPIWRRGRDPCG